MKRRILFLMVFVPVAFGAVSLCAEGPENGTGQTPYEMVPVRYPVA